MSTAQLERITQGWKELSPVLRVPRTEREYDELVAFLDQLVDVVGEDESHPLAGLMDVVGSLIESYESANVPEL